MIYTPVFYPMIGGLENVAALIAHGLHELGHQVCVVCFTDGKDAREPFAFKVVRHPSSLELLRRVRWSDVVLQMQVSLKGIWPLLIFPRPLVVSHQTWLSEWDRPITWRGRLKRLLCRFATNIACSHAVADALKLPCTVVANPYDDTVFKQLPDIARDKDLLFVGRLVSDKGACVLLAAVGALAREGIRPSVTIVGSGPEDAALRQQADDLDIKDQTSFAGPLRGGALAVEMNRHRFLVVPSLWPEPFGIVALEGLACGCHVIGSEQGGLRDAMGDNGTTFPNGDAKGLEEVLHAHLPRTTTPQAADVHLRRCTPAATSATYLDCFPTC